MSLGAPEIIIIILVIVVLFGATWVFKSKRSLKRSGGTGPAAKNVNDAK